MYIYNEKRRPFSRTFDTCANSGKVRNKICKWKLEMSEKNPEKILVEPFYAHALEALPP